MLLGGKVIANEAEIGVSSLDTIVQFTPDLTELEHSNCLESPYVELNNLQWSVQLCKTQLDAREYLTVRLNASSPNEIVWSSDAVANFKLFPQGQNSAVVEKTLPKQTYSNQNPSHEIQYFIDYEIFMRDYVEDFEANFEIEISTSKTKHSDSGLQQIYTKFHVLLKDVTNLGKRSLPEVILRGIRWTVVIERIDNKISLFVEADKNDFDKSVTYDSSAIISVLSLDSQKPAHSSKFANNIRWSSNKLGTNDFLEWTSFMDPQNQYIFDNEAHLIVEIRVGEPKSLWENN